METPYQIISLIYIVALDTRQKNLMINMRDLETGKLAVAFLIKFLYICLHDRVESLKKTSEANYRKLKYAIAGFWGNLNLIRDFSFASFLELVINSRTNIITCTVVQRPLGNSNFES